VNCKSHYMQFHVLKASQLKFVSHMPAV